MLVVSLLLSISLLQWVESNQCLPCSCDCGNIPWSTTPPCINCNRMNLEEIPVFSLNLTNGVKTRILRYNHITTLPHGIFMNYTNLEMLLLRGNKISNISSDMFTGLRKLKSLGLDFNKIQAFQPHTFRHLEMLEVLWLYGNEINVISNNTFTGLRRLKELYLHNNKIQHLKPNTFRHLEMLEKLSLYGNEINDISNNTFTGLRRLKLLYLHDNKIQHLKPNTFRHQEMLEKLSLYGNKINDICNNTFNGLRRLKRLVSHNNKIQHLKPNTFRHLEMLEELWLYGNEINEISNNTFNGLRKLKYLYLNENKIQLLKPNTFRHLEILEKLSLYGNKINDICNNTFNGLRRLKLLYLHDNKIQLLKPHTFRHLEMLEELSLYGNKINDISNSTFNGLRRLKELGLHDNKIQHLKSHTFRHLEMLEELSLYGNEINDISNNALTGLRRLKDLSLQYNKIQHLKPHTFRHQEMLELLSLFGNEINDISNNTFNGLRRLKELYLHNNKIQHLKPNTFRYLEMLEVLWLKGNEINEISNSTFNGLRRLKLLYLHNNKIQHLKPHTFRHQEMLKEIWMGNNNISKVLDNTWYGLVRLRILFLSYNQLQDIRAEMFSNLLSLEGLYLDGNRIHSIERDAFLNLKDLRRLYLSNIGMKEIPDALWGPRFSDTAIYIRNNPFNCSCKLLNDVNQLKFKVNKLHYSSSYLEKQCKNITTTVCEEKRNFALGMIFDNNCYGNRLTSFHNIADGNYNSSGTCTQAPDPCNFYLRINLPGDIVVTNVIVKVELSKLGTANITIEVGDEISGRYKQCNNFTLLPRSGVIFSDNECASAPAGRNARIKFISKDCPWNSEVKVYEVVVNGYDQNKYNLWSNWGEWSTCSTPCDNGKRIRMRQCNNATSLKCLLPNTNNQRSHNHEDKQICNLGPCFRSVYQWTIGGVCGVFILTVFGIIFWYRKFKMVTYFDGLRPNPNFVMDPDRTLLEQIEELPYDLHWEFPRYDVKFGSVIDEGHFGKVWLAKAKGIKAFNPRDKSDLSSRAKLAKLQDQHVHDYFTTVTEAWLLGDCDSTHHYEVAVKTLKECATPKHEKDMANELKILIYMGPHPNIINILASCTIRGDLWIILEYCDHGCLKKFLSDRRHTFTPAWSKESVDISKEICFFDLLRMCEQIAKGLMFLSSWRVVHRDISARNVLVDANFNVKIADFGLARSDGFVSSPDDIMPIRWSAIESLLRNEYTLKSDVWSLGVLYWEIFSLGEVPYPGMSSKEVIYQLKEGYLMDPPKNCPPEIWAIILDCWQTNPEFRPTAAELFEQLDEVKVTICAAPDGQYYGTSTGEYDQAGTVKGPSLKMILESKENMGCKEDESIRPTLSNTQEGAYKMNGSGPSTVTYDKYRDLETDNLTLQNTVSNLSKKVYQLEEQNTKIEYILKSMDLKDENVRKIKTILLFENNIDLDHTKDDEEEGVVADTTC